jgi:glycosyltransferase involved in cell wall biosynthesis
MVIGLIVPVLNNFKGFAEMMHSVDVDIHPIIFDNWTDNHGVSIAWNAGLEKAIDLGLETVAFVNDDVVFPPGTLDKLIESSVDCDLVSGVNHDDAESGLYYDGFPDYSCFLVKPQEFVEKFGWFDENFSPAYFEDNDMHYRIKVAGGKSALRLDARFHHVGSVTQYAVAGGVVNSEMFEMNRTYYVQKWGGQPREERFLTPFNDPSKTHKDW